MKNKYFRKTAMVLAGLVVAGVMAMTHPAFAMQANAAEYATSGVTGVHRLSIDELRALYRAIPECEQNIYTKKATFGQGQYAIAELKDSSMDHALAWVNYYRVAAGLPEISFTEELNESAAYGALVDAAYGELSHYPTRPADMSEDIYKPGASATAASNLSWSRGYAENSVLRVAISGQMEDEADWNITTLGHRRWLLNPRTLTMGLGTADNETGYYTDIRVFGSGVQTKSSVPYQFIAWPASGANLSEVFGDNTPWSVTLAPDVYNTAKLGQVTVTLTQCSDNKQWNFGTGTTNSNGAYFGINTGGYGVANCIIFRTASSDRPTYEGEYIVEVNNLYLKDGSSTSLKYQVNFDSIMEGLSFENTFPKSYAVDYIPQYGKTCYDFVPEVSGTYIFESSGDCDTVVMIYDRSGALVGSSDDDGEGYNFKASVKLTAGEKYQLQMWNYHSIQSRFTVTVDCNIPFRITGQPASTSVKEGGTVTFTVAAEGSELTYQWQKSSDGKTWVNSGSAGAKTSALTMTTKSSFDGLQFRCVVKDCMGRELISDVVSLTVVPSLTINSQPASMTVNAGEAVSFSVKATGSGLTYQWQKSSDGKTWGNSASTGAKTNTLQMTAKESFDGLKFRCKVTDANGTVKYSSAATLTVKAVNLPEITSQPASTSVTAGQTVTFSVTAKGSSLTYQWQKSTDGGKTWVNSASTGAKTATLQMAAKASFNGLQFRCTVKDASGKSVTSTAAILTVTAAGPSITGQPVSASVTAGQTASFTVSASGSSLTYQWQKSTDGGKTWVNSASTGAKTSNLQIVTKVSFNGLQFRCKVTDGSGNAVVSNAATLSVN